MGRASTSICTISGRGRFNPLSSSSIADLRRCCMWQLQTEDKYLGAPARKASGSGLQPKPCNERHYWGRGRMPVGDECRRGSMCKDSNIWLSIFLKSRQVKAAASSCVSLMGSGKQGNVARLDPSALFYLQCHRTDGLSSTMW